MKIRSTLAALAFGAVLLGLIPFPVSAIETEAARPAAPAYLYRATFVRAAPGKLLDLIALYKERMAVLDAAGDERPLWWKHSQGDQWDLMLLYPMGSYSEYYAKPRIARREKAAGASRVSEDEFRRRLEACTSWREDLFVRGPALEAVKKEFLPAAYYHIEIMISLPGKQAELVRERGMESAYQTGIGRPPFLIFVRDAGANWDVFTLDCYRDLKHWASSADVTKEQREAAAKAAGFDGPDAIGPYMRSLIEMHRDTQGPAIK